jgi:hypothetical protein
MRVITEIQPVMSFMSQAPTLPDNFLLCYELEMVPSLVWPINLYLVRRTDRAKQTHGDRRLIKDIVFKLRMKHKGSCKGYGFVCDIDEQTVAVPAEWKIPDTFDYEGYDVTLSHTLLAKATDAAHSAIVAGIIREGIKKHFKEHPVSNELGVLWQDYSSFCQMPGETTESGYNLCRRFSTSVKRLRGGRWAMECVINTAMIDGRTLAEYYRLGEVEILAEMIEAKRNNRLTRGNAPPGIRVWQNKSSEYTTAAAVLEIDDPDVIIEHAKLRPREQKSLVIDTISCRPFPRPATDIPLSELRLILDAHIVGEDHSDTIIDPAEREQLAKKMRDFVSGADIYERRLILAPTPFNADSVPSIDIAPPSLRVRGEEGAEAIIPALVSAGDVETNLRMRARDRWDSVRRHGFLQRRSINPLLAFPHQFGEQGAVDMKRALNLILERQGIDYRFEFFRFKEVDEVRKEVEREGYDALIVVLPETSWRGNRPEDTHEKIKKRIEAPSQCIHIDNTLPKEWVGKPYREFQKQKPKLARRLRQTYGLCVLNLLVKHGWVPFAPIDPFHYNVQIGLDVGGRHNTQVMACLGYGFREPQNGLLFRPEEIPIDLSQAEPIPTQYLYRGLLSLYEFIHSELTGVGLVPDFERTLFIRDGSLLGDGDDWNEREAFHLLHAELQRRGWLSTASIWTAVELSKRAEDLRLMRNKGGVKNPVSGKCIFPFDNDNEALICTTGAPHLSQGTAAPILVRISDIYGKAICSEAIRDIVWGADMAFTKPDTGMKLPWVLHVADTGALQMSRSYKISGITV